MNQDDANRSRRLNDVLRDVFKGDREQLIARSGLSKGRISQMLSGRMVFGERAARSLEAKLGLRREYLDEPSGGHSVNEPAAHFGEVTQLIRSELDMDPDKVLHSVLKFLHIYDEDEQEVLALIQAKHERAVKMMAHFQEIQAGKKPRAPALPAPQEAKT